MDYLIGHQDREQENIIQEAIAKGSINKKSNEENNIQKTITKGPNKEIKEIFQVGDTIDFEILTGEGQVNKKANDVKTTQSKNSIVDSIQQFLKKYTTPDANKIFVGDSIDFEIPTSKELNNTIQPIIDKMKEYFTTMKIPDKNRESIAKLVKDAFGIIKNKGKIMIDNTTMQIFNDSITHLKKLGLNAINTSEKKILLIYIALCIYGGSHLGTEFPGSPDLVIQEKTEYLNRNKDIVQDNIKQIDEHTKVSHQNEGKKTIKKIVSEEPTAQNNSGAAKQKNNNQKKTSSTIQSTAQSTGNSSVQESKVSALHHSDKTLTVTQFPSNVVYFGSKKSQGQFKKTVLEKNIESILKQRNIDLTTSSNGSKRYNSISNVNAKKIIKKAYGGKSSKQFIDGISTGNYKRSGNQTEIKINDMAKKHPEMDLVVIQLSQHNFNNASTNFCVALKFLDLKTNSYKRYIYNPGDTKHPFHDIETFIDNKPHGSITSLAFFQSGNHHNATANTPTKNDFTYIPGKYNTHYLFAVDNYHRGIIVPEDNFMKYKEAVEQAKKLAHAKTFTFLKDSKEYQAWNFIKNIAEDRYYDLAFAIQESKVTLNQGENVFGDYGVKQINKGDAYTEIKRYCPYFRTKALKNLQPHENIVASRILRYIQQQQFYTLQIKGPDGIKKALSKIVPQKDYKYIEALGYNGGFGTVKAVCEFNINNHIPVNRDNINTALVKYGAGRPEVQLSIQKEYKDKKTGEVKKTKRNISKRKAKIMGTYANAILWLQEQGKDLNLLG